MKYVFSFFLLTIALFAGVVKTPTLSVNNAANTATIKINTIDVGVSGFIVHRFSENNSVIVKEVVVISYNEETNIAKLEMQDYTDMQQNALPVLETEVEVGDIVILAFGYTRAILIAPNEEIYYRITKATSKIQWLHPDLFATVLAYNSHPTPLKEDFISMSNITSAGLVFIYINQKLFTVDAKSLVILNTTDAPLTQTQTKLPFYMRIEGLESNWYSFGEGTGELQAYEPYYCRLLTDNNPTNKEIEKICSMKAKHINKGESTWSIKNISNTLFRW
ncbi:plasminogen-binding N-terminal domain-containing protein [Sulfurimonas sp. SAG-AH-194-I05]|nr:plasminogen-binding N-terminal domain-containing protein [Sulfurimonas sp. SAG-AH-194-I05]MDF1874291.1 plasminogen-binding N-terminal domain-containing protein [Sulfurimonas sp. SAG-AH-194-I05]